jgi:hypothetical protein
LNEELGLRLTVRANFEVTQGFSSLSGKVFRQPAHSDTIDVCGNSIYRSDRLCGHASLPAPDEGAMALSRECSSLASFQILQHFEILLPVDFASRIALPKDLIGA